MPDYTDPEYRKTIIGGSDIGTIMGLNKWQTPINLWEVKSGRVPPFEGNQKTKYGLLLEPVVAKDYADLNDVQIRDTNHDYTLPSFPWAVAHPDRLIVRGDHPAHRGVEIKCSDQRMADQWGESGESDDVPAMYQAQVHWYMMILDAEWWDVATLIGGWDYRQYRFERDKALEADMLEAAQKFYVDAMINDQQPDVIGTEAEKENLKRMFPDSSEVMLQADPTIDLLSSALRATRFDEKKLGAQKLKVENEIKAFLGDARGVETSEGALTWTKNKDSEKIDWKGAYAEAIALASTGTGFIGLPPQKICDLLFGVAEKHTTTKEGARVFRVPRSWNKD